MVQKKNLHSILSPEHLASTGACRNSSSIIKEIVPARLIISGHPISWFIGSHWWKYIASGSRVRSVRAFDLCTKLWCTVQTCPASGKSIISLKQTKQAVISQFVRTFKRNLLPPKLALQNTIILRYIHIYTHTDVLNQYSCRYTHHCFETSKRYVFWQLAIL